MRLFSSPRIFRCLILSEREDLDLSVNLQGRGYVMCLCFSLEIFNLLVFSLRIEGLDLEGPSLRERRFDLRGSLGGRLGRLKMRGSPPLHLRSNFDLDFLLGLYLGLILI